VNTRFCYSNLLFTLFCQALSYCKNLQSQLYQEQQYRLQFATYVESESQRLKQIFFYTNDVGKNCKEASSQLRKLK